MPILTIPGKIVRGQVQNARHALWVFGDNMLRKGLGGQAAAMRGEPNALGIATKWAPGRDNDDYFSPGDWHDARVQERMRLDFGILATFARAGGTIYLPEAGIGTGLSQLQDRAPIFLEKFDHWFKEIEKL